MHNSAARHHEERGPTCIGVYHNYADKEKQGFMVLYCSLFPLPSDSDWKFGNVGTKVTVFAESCNGRGARPRSGSFRCCDECHAMILEKRHNKIYQTIKDRAIKTKSVQLALRRQDSMASEGKWENICNSLSRYPNFPFAVPSLRL